MDDGVKVVLQVDALRQAVGRNEDSARVVTEFGDDLGTFGRRDLAADAAHLDVRKLFGERVRVVVDSWDVAAEHDWVAAVFEQLTDDVDEAGEFCVLGERHGFGEFS